MKGFSIIILVVFMVIGVFGFFVMDREMMMSNGRSCFASVNGNAPCSQEAPLGFASFHLEALRFFSGAVFEYLAISLFICAVFLFFGQIFSGNSQSILIPATYHQYVISKEHFCFPSARRFMRWFAIQERKIPPVLRVCVD